jgi:hypothetical protein
METSRAADVFQGKLYFFDSELPKQLGAPRFRLFLQSIGF